MSWADAGKSQAAVVLEQECKNGCVFVQDCENRMPHAPLVVNCDFMTEEANGILFIAFLSTGRTQIMKLTWIRV